MKTGSHVVCLGAGEKNERGREITYKSLWEIISLKLTKEAMKQSHRLEQIAVISKSKR